MEFDCATDLHKCARDPQRCAKNPQMCATDPTKMRPKWRLTAPTKNSI